MTIAKRRRLMRLRNVTMQPAILLVLFTAICTIGAELYFGLR